VLVVQISADKYTNRLGIPEIFRFV